MFALNQKPMKKIFLFNCVMLITALSFNVNAQSTSWFLSGTNQAMNIQQTIQLADHSMIIAGNMPDPADSSFYPATYLVVARISSDGSIIWARKSIETGFSINGMSEINNQLFISYDLTNYDSLTTRSEIMKMDLSGVVIKNISMNSDYGQYAQNKFLLMPNNNFLMLRSVFYEIEVQCFDSDLNIVWSKRVGDSSVTKNPAMNFCLSNSGDVFICGKRESSLEFITISPQGQFISGRTFDDPSMSTYLRAYNVFPVADGYIIQGMLSMISGNTFMIKANEQGDIVWMKYMQDANNIDYNFVISNGAALQNGNFVFTGFTYNGKNVIGEMNADGNIIWSKINDENAYYGSTSPLSVNGNTIVTAYQKNIYPYGNGLALLSASRNDFLNDQVCDFVDNSISLSELVFDYDVNNVPAGYFVDLPAAYNTENINMIDFTSGLDIMELCSNVGIHNIENQNAVSVYPVPATETVTLHLGNPSGISAIQIYDVLGQLMWSENKISKSEFNIPVTDFPAGVYSFTINQNGSLITEKFVVQH